MLQRQLAYALGLFVAAGLGVFLGSELGRRSAGELERRLARAEREIDALLAVGTASSASGSGDTVADRGALVAALRNAVKEELLAAGSRASKPNEDAPPGAASPARSADINAALAEGRSLIDAARADGRWDQQDADTLRALVGRIDDKGRDELLVNLSKSVNLGELSVETNGPLL